MNKYVSVFATIDNLLDRSPPVAPGGNGYPTNPVYFDTYGMTWKLGFRARFRRDLNGRAGGVCSIRVILDRVCCLAATGVDFST